jgi:carbonic anhydrase
MMVLGCGEDDPLAAEGADGHWSYAGSEGPEHWADLHEDYETCQTGSFQSPVDFPASVAPAPLDVLATDYAPSSGALVDNGHTLQVGFDDAANQALVDGEAHRLVQFHFHARSEHMMAGEAYPLEMHLVHQSASGGLAVVGVFFEVGAESVPLREVLSATPGTHDEPMMLQELVDLPALLPGDDSGWAYSGSLTTPPCTEGVKWHVHATPMSVSEEQLNAFTALHPDSYRPVMNNADVTEAEL